ncbi:MAG: flagellar assembly peptidoglycan hydrolase FlgJ [Halioglobus sp.]
MSTAGAAAYYDFQGLAALRSDALQRPSQAIGEVAAQFESLFVQMMLKSMRDATIKGGLFDSNQMDTYQSMYDQQVSLHLSTQGGLGLSEILVEQLEGRAGTSAAAERSDKVTELARLLPGAREQAAPEMPLTPAQMPARATAAPRAEAPSAQYGATRQPPLVPEFVPARAASAVRGERPGQFAPRSPEEFIRGIWEHAVGAANRLGVEPQVLVAQSALETGWGRKVIRSSSGDSSFNLFGIKAGNEWQGDAATVRTLEFRDGVAALEKAAFRVYDSLAGSFDDYVDFLSGNPRYQSALESAPDSRAFLRGLQDAGYATDPAYAEKILSIINTEAYDAIFSELKNSASLSLR